MIILSQEIKTWLMLGYLKEKTKVLASTKSKEARIVDPKMQISTDKYREIRRHRVEQKSRYEQGETSKAKTTKPHVTSRILLNKCSDKRKRIISIG